MNEHPQRFFLLAAVLIGFLALALRVYELDRDPPEFFEDEIASATSAWSLATTGHDLEKTTLPFVRTRLVIQQPIYPLSTVPFWAVLGHTPFAERLPAALYGVASVLLVIWLMRLLGRPDEEALFAGGIAAILPWAVHFGRVGWEPAALIPFTLGGLGLLWKGLRDDRPVSTVAGAVVLALGSYAYIAGLFMHVLLAALVVAIYHRRVRKNAPWIATGAGLAGIILVPFVLGMRDPLFFMRPEKVSVFANGVGFTALKKAAVYYWWQWTPRGLFTSLSYNLRDKPGAMLFWWMLPFLIVGFVVLLRRHSQADVFLLGWLLLSPLPAALTYDGPAPNFARGITRWPVIVMVTAVGVLAIVRHERVQRIGREWQTALVAVLALAIVIQGFRFYRDYFDLEHGYPARSAAWWYYGTGAAMRAVKENVAKGHVACIDGVSYFTFPNYVAYYLGTKPRARVIEGLDDPRCVAPGSYILAPPDAKVKATLETIATIRDLDGQPVFVLSRDSPRREPSTGN